MRLLMVHDVFQPLGGSERSVRVHLSGLVERGHSILAATTTDQASHGSHDPEFRSVDWLAVPPSTGLRSARRTAARLDEAAGRFGADLVELGNVYGLLGPTGALALTRRQKVVRACRDTRPTCPRLDRILPSGMICLAPPGSICARRRCLKLQGHRKGARSWLDTRLRLRALRRAQAVTVESESMADLLHRLGVEPARVHRLPLAVRMPEPAPSPPSQAPPHVLALGVLGHPRKGLDHLLRTFDRVRHPGARLRLTGAFGAAWAAAEDGVHTGPCADRIDALGWLSEEALEAEFQNCRVLAFPSRFLESFGLAGAEAAAAGRPVVAVDCGGSREWMVDGETGALVDRDDPEAMAHALDRYLDEPGRADAHGAAGRSLVRRRFTRMANLDAITRVYEEVIAG